MLYVFKEFLESFKTNEVFFLKLGAIAYSCCAFLKIAKQ